MSERGERERERRGEGEGERGKNVRGEAQVTIQAAEAIQPGCEEWTKEVNACVWIWSFLNVDNQIVMTMIITCISVAEGDDEMLCLPCFHKSSPQRWRQNCDKPNGPAGRIKKGTLLYAIITPALADTICWFSPINPGNPGDMICSFKCHTILLIPGWLRLVFRASCQGKLAELFNDHLCCLLVFPQPELRRQPSTPQELQTCRPKVDWNSEVVQSLDDLGSLKGLLRSPRPLLVDPQNNLQSWSKK